MQDLICPFGATQAKEDFGCRHASKIIRRGGTEFACDSAGMHVACNHLFQRLKDVALPEFEVADDLTQVPHSVLVKIQFGGLLGLQRITGTEAKTVADIAALIDTATSKFACIDAIPCESLCGDIISYRLPRRSRR